MTHRTWATEADARSHADALNQAEGQENEMIWRYDVAKAMDGSFHIVVLDLDGEVVGLVPQVQS